MNANDQVNKILFENEQLTASLERLRNENNVIKIEIQELTIGRENERTSKELLVTEKKTLEKTIEGLQRDLNDVYAELEELDTKYKKLKQQVSAVEEKAGCPLSEFATWRSRCLEKTEEVEIFMRELAFCKGMGSFNGISGPDDSKTERILAEFYKSLNVANRRPLASEPKAPEPASLPAPIAKESSMVDRIHILEEELAQKRAENSDMSARLEELQKRLALSKNIIDRFENEIGVYRTHSFLQEKKEAFDFRRAIQNLETLDSKLKIVYSNCIDLFVHLDKQLLIQMEKKLNDCIIEFKEIRDLLLNQL